MPTDTTALTPERVRAARKKLGLTQPQFALYLGRQLKRGIRPSSWTVMRWESGQKKPGPLYATTLERIVRLTEEME